MSKYRKYVYLGGNTAISLPPEQEGGEPIEIRLIQHSEVELPESLPYVKRLWDKGLLMEPAAASAPAKSEDKKEAKA